MEERLEKVAFPPTRTGAAEERMLRADLVREIVTRRERSEGTRRIAHALGVDRKTARRWLRVGGWQLIRLEAETRRLRETQPLVAYELVDVVISNCVLNLVHPVDKRRCSVKFSGKTVIFDVVSHEDIPERLQRDPELWSGGISGALREALFLEAFEEAGFYGVTLLHRQSEPWRASSFAASPWWLTRVRKAFVSTSNTS